MPARPQPQRTPHPPHRAPHLGGATPSAERAADMVTGRRLALAPPAGPALAFGPPPPPAAPAPGPAAPSASSWPNTELLPPVLTRILLPHWAALPPCGRRARAPPRFVSCAHRTLHAVHPQPTRSRAPHPPHAHTAAPHAHMAAPHAHTAVPHVHARGAPTSTTGASLVSRSRPHDRHACASRRRAASARSPPIARHTLELPTRATTPPTAPPAAPPTPPVTAPTAPRTLPVTPWPALATLPNTPTAVPAALATGAGEGRAGAGALVLALALLCARAASAESLGAAAGACGGPLRALLSASQEFTGSSARSTLHGWAWRAAGCWSVRAAALGLPPLQPVRAHVALHRFNPCMHHSPAYVHAPAPADGREGARGQRPKAPLADTQCRPSPTPAPPAPADGRE